MSCPGGYRACHYNECQHQTAEATRLRHEIERLEHENQRWKEDLEDVSPEERTDLAERINLNQIEIDHLHQDLASEKENDSSENDDLFEDPETTARCYGNDLKW